MSRINQPLSLSESEAAELQQMLQKGVHSVRSLTRAQVLLSLHQGNKPEQVVQQVRVSRATVYNIAQRYKQEGITAALTERPRPGQPSKFDKALQAQLTALACSPAPEGRFDERPCQLLGEILAPLSMLPGQPTRQDYEYERNGTACVLLAYDLDTHQRYVQVRKQRTKKDYAEFMDWLLKTHYPESHQIHLVQDNLNTHQAGSFYEWLAVERAHEMKNQLLFHYTPNHGSWLNMAEPGGRCH